MTKREQANQLNQQALELQKQGQRQQAIDLYLQAAALDRRSSTPLYNLGLLFKRERHWKKSFLYNRRAAKRDPDNQAAWWNLGIAATALGRWDDARAAWRGFGVDVPDGDGPIDFPCGYGPIRLNPEGEGEVVWAHRIDPARAVLSNIPFPESRHGWQDVVLNDGAPNGYRPFDGKEVPVLDELQLLERSPFGTYVAEVKMPDAPHLIEQLAEMANLFGGSAEDWSTSVQIICKACSEGRPHADHEGVPAPTDGVHFVGVAARDRKHASRILHAWESEGEGIHVESLDEALAPGLSK